MEATQATNRWDWLYATRALDTLGWYEPEPSTSLRLVDDAVRAGARSIIDVGGGGSFLVDRLVDLGLDRVTIVDVSEAGMAVAKHRLGRRASSVDWIVGDLAALPNVGTADLWHDRAAFHFLLEADARARYAGLAARTVPVGGSAIVATFAEDGPERCSGMPIQRYDAASLAAEFHPAFRLTGEHRYSHHTPAGFEQRFLYVTLERVAS
jgi:SAM-dependent methyltransferase